MKALGQGAGSCYRIYILWQGCGESSLVEMAMTMEFVLKLCLHKKHPGHSNHPIEIGDGEHNLSRMKNI